MPNDYGYQEVHSRAATAPITACEATLGEQLAWLAMRKGFAFFENEHVVIQSIIKALLDRQREKSAADTADRDPLMFDGCGND